MSLTVPRCHDCGQTMIAVAYKSFINDKPSTCLVCPKCDGPVGSANAPTTLQ